MKPATFFRWQHDQAPGWLAACAIALTLSAYTIGLPPAQAATALAQTSPSATAAPKERKVAKPAASRPTWNQLSAEQQRALQPLALNWDTLPAERKRKWLALSKNFHAMSASEQALLHSRMRDWVLLSQQQRSQARLNYAETRSLSAEEKAAQWRSYLSLSADERRRLAAEAPATAGAAVVRPLPTEKHAYPQQLPASQQRLAEAKAHKLPIQRNTLLPIQSPPDGPDHQPIAPAPVTELQLPDPASAAPR